MSKNEMSSTEMAALFGEKVPVENNSQTQTIYEVAARIKNMASVSYKGGIALTPHSVMLCNTYTHVMMAFYAFAETLPDLDKERMKAFIRTQEGMPANFIAAAFVGVNAPKQEE